MRKIFGLAMMLTSSLTVFSATAAGVPKELNLGILGGQNATQQIGDNQCVKQFLDKELGVETRLRNASDYSGVIQGLLGGKVDLVLSMSPSSFASVYLKDPNAVDIVGIAVDDKDQSRGYYSVVVVKADSPYKKLEDLKGKSFGFADRFNLGVSGAQSGIQTEIWWEQRQQIQQFLFQRNVLWRP